MTEVSNVLWNGWHSNGLARVGVVFRGYPSQFLSHPLQRGLTYQVLSPAAIGSRPNFLLNDGETPRRFESGREGKTSVHLSFSATLLPALRELQKLLRIK